MRHYTQAVAAAGILLSAMVGSAAAQAYPERAITLVVPFGAGGVTDTTARLLSEPMSEALGQPVVVENRPGAGGLVGTETVISSDPDGYTILYASSGPMAILPALTPGSVRYDPMTALRHVHGVSYSSQLLVVPQDAPYQTVEELIAYAQENPASLNFGSPGIGTAQHLAGELFRHATDVDIQHVPYRTGGNQLADLVSGVIDLTFDYSAVLAPYIDGGQLRVLATTGIERHTRFPDVPSLSEAGYPDATNAGWTLMSAPAGTPDEVVTRISDALRDALGTERLITYLEGNGTMSLIDYGPEKITGFVAEENAKFRDIVEAAGISIE
ncbi:Bug family tripartite tricarboxylate transporter substrate binding protein [Mesorhizobium xinjiangense]|uniref:Bug family tripartite tricarboxylate transporter substrate binding protein n=1 Tax=Mesorhizobium xinjiangense TaxID=2678685 RepID=UPI0012EE6497|nr:tripartite tricarboxylate transporter substrate binding protein [Mesorhizobium xinjiangense]